MGMFLWIILVDGVSIFVGNKRRCSHSNGVVELRDILCFSHEENQNIWNEREDLSFLSPSSFLLLISFAMVNSICCTTHLATACLFSTLSQGTKSYTASQDPFKCGEFHSITLRGSSSSAIAECIFHSTTQKLWMNTFTLTFQRYFSLRSAPQNILWSLDQHFHPHVFGTSAQELK